MPYGLTVTLLQRDLIKKKKARVYALINKTRSEMAIAFSKMGSACLCAATRTEKFGKQIKKYDGFIEMNK